MGVSVGSGAGDVAGDGAQADGLARVPAIGHPTGVYANPGFSDRAVMRLPVMYGFQG